MKTIYIKIGLEYDFATIATEDDLKGNWTYINTDEETNMAVFSEWDWENDFYNYFAIPMTKKFAQFLKDWEEFNEKLSLGYWD